MKTNNSKETAIYNTVTVEACKNGWIVKQKGKPVEVFFQWRNVINRLEFELITKGESCPTR